jgi:hypothetical protein
VRADEGVMAFGSERMHPYLGEIQVAVTFAERVTATFIIEEVLYYSWTRGISVSERRHT